MTAAVQPVNKTRKPAVVQLRAAYGVCRHVARSAARNFYYGFLVLPRPKRNALSAVYAFMRHCDDITDEQMPGTSLNDRRNRLRNWQQALHQVIAGQPTDDPVLMALADTRRRCEIPVSLLDQLVEGTAMDLREEVSPQNPLLFETFDDLYRYCYHVASVVGLVSIRIFGYRDPNAEQLAEHLGVAFQLTNILRDVKEDAQMGRVYLPLEYLRNAGLTPTDVLAAQAAAPLKPVMRQLYDAAEKFYADGRALLELVDKDSRPALWALQEIYHRLLLRIAARDFEVFNERVRVPTSEKLLVLGRGMARRVLP